MSLRLITPPVEMPVSLTEAKAALRVDGDDLDVLITAWIAGITAHAEHYMQRSIINQTWRLTLDRFPDAFKLSNPPIVSVNSVKYIDPDGATQTLDPADYLVDSESEPGYIVPAPNRAWPDTLDRINAVTVEYVAGYGADATSTPDAIRLYLLAKLVEQFDPTATQQQIDVQPSYVDRLLDRHIIWGF